MKKKVRLNNKIIGELDEEKLTFTKKVRKSKHLFRALDSWGIDNDFFKENLLPKNFLIIVKELEEGKEYKITAEDFYANGAYFHFKGQEKDHRLQLFCPRDKFNNGNKQTIQNLLVFPK